MTLTLRFILLVAALLLGVAASAASGYLALERLDRALDTIVKTDMERLLAITHTRRLFRSMVVLERDYMLSASAEERHGFDKKMAKASVELEQQLEKYAKLMPAEDKSTIEAIRGARTRWLELDDKVRAAARNDSKDTVKLAALHAKDPVSWETAIGGLVKASESRLAKQVESTHQTYLTARRRIFSVSGFAALLAAGLGSLIFLGIRRNMNEVLVVNTNLEAIVEQRTLALGARERSLRLVLDSTGDGIIGVTPGGNVAEGASAAAERWFGTATPGTPLAKYLFPDDPHAELSFEVAFEQLTSDLMPWDAAVDQVPRRLKRGGTLLELDFKRVAAPGSELSLLVLARDVTERVKSALAEQEAREQQAVVSKLLADKNGFASFVTDTERLLLSLQTEQDAVLLKRNLHTLKGNVAIFGLASLAKRCHEVEDKLELEGQVGTDAFSQLTTLFRAKMQSIDAFFSGGRKGVYEVETDEHEALMQSLLRRKDYKELLEMVETWTWPRTSEHLGRLRAQVEYTAERLQKQVEVVVEHNDLRVPVDYLDQFWPTLAHVARNSVDHGVEPPDVREALGKKPSAKIRLSTRQDEDYFFVEISDDGGGIDAQALLHAAEVRGVKVAAGQDPLLLIFADGVSTREEITDLSGRGVGLSATKAACEAAGGQVLVRSERTRGTRFVFRFRRPFVKLQGPAEMAARRWSLRPIRLGFLAKSGDPRSS
jgi:signal transduction histidine kinase